MKPKLAHVLVFVLFPCTSDGQLHIAKPYADLGAIRAGTRLTHRVEVSNDGPEVIEIVDIRGSCGCLHPTISTNLLVPGQKANVQMTINPFGQPSGKQRWRSFLRYRVNGITHQKTIEATARLITEVTIQPSRLTLYPSGSIRRSLTFIDLREKPLTITGTNTACSWLKAGEATPIKQSGGKWTAQIPIASCKPIPPGKHSFDVVILTNDPVYRELHVPISVVKRDAKILHAIPSEIVLRLPGGTSIVSRLVRIRSRNNSLVKIEKIRCDHPGISCRWASGPGRFTTIRVQADRSKISEKNFTCRINVTSAVPVDETLTLNVICVID